MANKKITDLSAGTISGTQLLFNGNPSTGALSKNTFSELATFINSGASTPLVYAAIISQSSTSAPTANISGNTTGTTITFSRVTTGEYHATASSAVFTSFKTLAFLQNVFATCLIEVTIISTDTVKIKTYNAGTFTEQDGLLSSNSFKIEIYP